MCSTPSFYSTPQKWSVWHTFQPDLLNGWGKSGSSRCRSKRGAGSRSGWDSTAAEAQPVLQANEVRYYFCSGLNVTLLGLFKSLVCWLIFVLTMPVRFCLLGVVFHHFNLMPVRLAVRRNCYLILPVRFAWVVKCLSKLPVWLSCAVKCLSNIACGVCLRGKFVFGFACVAKDFLFC